MKHLRGRSRMSFVMTNNIIISHNNYSTTYLDFILILLAQDPECIIKIGFVQNIISLEIIDNLILS